ncbi:hypothetical protein LTR84_009775 [Exophiala bonariae]|uniref:ERCC4 domain-containing protein n=1 Tax=Exophiala bonariae TaxID=1690606 RepID=A0AAV9NKU3_9EURO|nr:hypothetical protein LTR84_009775 [Exophiala bonariae]
MPEVIELVSSSPVSSLRGTKNKKESPKNSIEITLDPGGSDFLDFENHCPSKKRRITSEFKQKTSVFDTSQFDLLSDDEVLPLPDYVGLTAACGKTQPSRLQTASTSFDDITFSSSAPELRQTRTGLGKAPWDVLSDNAYDAESQEDINAVFGDEPTDAGYSNRTALLLASLSQPLMKENKAPVRSIDTKTTVKPTKTRSKSEPHDDIVFSSSPAKARSSKASKPPADAKFSREAGKGAEKERKRLQRDAEKEAEKERKRLERERKTQEKQKAADLAEVNKSRTNKKSSAPEMIVDATRALQGTSIGNQVEEYMKQADIELHYIDEEFNLTADTAGRDHYGNIIRWRRKVGSTYNDEQDQWEPTSKTTIVREEHVLVHLTAVEFAATLTTSTINSTSNKVPRVEEMKTNIDNHVASIRSYYHPCTPIYLIEGMGTWLKKNVNAKNRQYTAAVRAQMNDSMTELTHTVPVGSQPRAKKRKKPEAQSLDLSFITSAHVEDLLLHLQLAHQPILIQHTTSPTNTASQILTLTQHLSTRPYRLAQLDYNLKNASFCMDSGQVKTGDNARETFAKMLQEVQRVTPSMAYGILDSWSTVTKLVGGFEKHGNLLLEDVRKSLNKDGAWSERRLGPMVSKRLYKVFMGRDPSATDGMS